MTILPGSLPEDDHLWYNEKQILGRYFLTQSMSYSSYAKELLASLYTGSALDDQITKLRENIFKNTVLPPSVIAGALWFDNMTEYINKLNTMQDLLAASIVQVIICMDSNTKLINR